VKRYGIRLTLPESDPMRAPHLLGPDWEAFRWYETAVERDDALERLRRGDVYYRPGDVQSLVLERVDR
jgi:uncharacterized Zn finger protein